MSLKLGIILMENSQKYQKLASFCIIGDEVMTPLRFHSPILSLIIHSLFTTQQIQTTQTS